MGLVVWLTGLSGSGKTTLAEAFAEALKKQRKSVVIIDGDDVRDKREKPLGFSREDIRENNRLIAELACEKKRAHDVILVPVISPYAEDRKENRRIVGENYIEVFVDCPLAVCEARDVKGLYKKARAGDIGDLIGMSEKNPYEKPTDAEVVVKTNQVSIDEAVAMLVEALQKNARF
ncbi:MAG: adenylyl-sulfate kinase [Parcubacteria group bacterium]|nr:adenylyl-sulfate kinase [Parcubacteria group bacterium]